MNKKTFSRLSVAILLLLTISTPAWAQEISVEAARQTAAKFINEHAAKLPAKSRKGMMKAPPKAESLQLVYTQEDQLHESPALYVFEQPKQGGFVIASADERVAPIFGYFEEGNFQDAIKESCCFKSVLENFGKQIAYARENGLPQFTSTLNDDNDFAPIEPITRDGVSWAQESLCEYFGWDDCISFNKYCPIDKNTGRRCDTGCTANTMGILMYHHQWPERGVGSHSYQWRDTTLTANFGETTYQYELMGPDESLETALLLYHCGVAVNMNYSSNGSGGLIHTNNAMERFFRYNYVKKITGGDYTKISEIHDALSHNNPLYANNSDHAFLIDGYQPGGFIHVNMHSNMANAYVHISGLKDGWFDWNEICPPDYQYDGRPYYISLFVPEKDVTTITKDEIEYEILFNKATITKGTGTGNLVIPSSVIGENGEVYPVTSIGDAAFYGCSGLTNITIPNSVTSIGGAAFSGCSGLTSVTIPNSVKSIGSQAFYNCSGLTSVTIGNSVTSIGSWAFYGCYDLKSVTIPNSVTSIGAVAFHGTGIYDNSADGVFYVDKWACGYKGTMPENTNLVIREGTLGIADYAFLSCSGLTSVTIPNSVTSIGDGAFYDCTGLTSVTFHCKEIGRWFSGNTAIKEIVLDEEVTTIVSSAFRDCTSLTSVTIPSSVTNIGTVAFKNCTGLQKVIVKNIAAWCGIEFGSNPLSYAKHLYSDENTEITDLVIPDGVTSIGSYAFQDCSGLTSITIPNSVTSIGNSAFQDCSGLTSITIPNSVTSIGIDAFYRCSGLTSVTIPNSVTSIDGGVFSGCI